MTVVDNVAPIVQDISSLYLKVYRTLEAKFEKLTTLLPVGRLMPTRPALLLAPGKTIVAFMACLIEGDEPCAEYIGLEYPVALDLHLYFIRSAT